MTMTKPLTITIANDTAIALIEGLADRVIRLRAEAGRRHPKALHDSFVAQQQRAEAAQKDLNEALERALAMPGGLAQVMEDSMKNAWAAGFKAGQRGFVTQGAQVDKHPRIVYAAPDSERHEAFLEQEERP